MIKLLDTVLFDHCVSVIDAVRSEICAVTRVKSLIDSSVPILSGMDIAAQLQQLGENEVTLSKLQEVSKACEQSICLNASAEHNCLVGVINKMQMFTERFCKLFKPPNAYHNLFEVKQQL